MLTFVTFTWFSSVSCGTDTCSDILVCPTRRSESDSRSFNSANVALIPELDFFVLTAAEEMGLAALWEMSVVGSGAALFFRFVGGLTTEVVLESSSDIQI
jgi:hypothetical protein